MECETQTAEQMLSDTNTVVVIRFSRNSAAAAAVVIPDREAEIKSMIYQTWVGIIAMFVFRARVAENIAENNFNRYSFVELRCFYKYGAK